MENKRTSEQNKQRTANQGHPHNEYFNELNKIVGQKVRAKASTGKEFVGTFTGFHAQHMNVSIKDEAGNVTIIKNLSWITTDWRGDNNV